MHIIRGLEVYLIDIFTIQVNFDQIINLQVNFTPFYTTFVVNYFKMTKLIATRTANHYSSV